MKRKLKTGLLLMASSLLMLACSKDDAEISASGLNASTSIDEMADYVASDLVGTWNITSMTANIPVDLNFDQTSSTNILTETDCFDPMFFTFDEAGNVTTGQAKLDFGLDGNKFECEYGEYSAKYEISGNELTIHFVLNGANWSQQKTIEIVKNDTGTFLHISLSELEADQYVTDPGGTVASDVESIESVYKLQE